MNLYNAEISAGAIMLVETKRLAKLLLEQPTQEEWNHALVEENILQKKTPSTAKRQAALIKKRLDTLTPVGLELITDGDNEVTSQMIFASCILHSELLKDYLQHEYAGHLRRLDTHLNPNSWDAFWVECANRDSSILDWSELTKSKLFQVILRILAQVKYIESNKSKRITPPILHPQVIRYLKQNNPEALQVMEQRQ